MDKISFEVGGHWPLWREWKTEWPRRKKPTSFWGFYL